MGHLDVGKAFKCFIYSCNDIGNNLQLQNRAYILYAFVHLCTYMHIYLYLCWRGLRSVCQIAKATNGIKDCFKVLETERGPG